MSKNNFLTHSDFERYKRKEYLEPTRKFLDEEYKVEFFREGRGYLAYCPFHREKEPSFKLYCKSYENKPEKVRLHCFGNCTLPKKNFDIFDFVQYKDNCSRRQAYEKVKKFFAKIVNHPTLSPNKKESPVIKEEKVTLRLDREKVILIRTKGASICHEILLTSDDPEVEKARDYLEQRGVDESLMKEFMIGYDPKLGSQVKGLIWHFKDDFANNYPLYEESGLFTMLSGVKKKWIDYSIAGPAAYYGDSLSQRIIFPLFNKEKKIVGLLGRKVGKTSKGNRYRFSRGTPKNEVLYGYKKIEPFLPTARNFIIVEGPFDFLSLWRNRLINPHSVAVACLGISLSQAQQELLFQAAPIWRKHQFKIRIDVLFDEDAQAKAVAIAEKLRASEILKDVNVEIYVTLLPKDSEDPNDFFNKHIIRGPLFFYRFPGIGTALIGTLNRSLEISPPKEKETSIIKPKEYIVDKNKLFELLSKNNKATNRATMEKKVKEIVNFIKSGSFQEGSGESIGIPASLIEPRHTKKMGSALTLLLDIWSQQRSRKRKVVTTAKKESKRLNISIRTYHKYKEKLIKLGFLVCEKKGQKSILKVRYNFKYLTS